MLVHCFVNHVWKYNSYIRYSFHLPYRQTEGIINATGKSLPAIPPSYGHMCKRINKLDVDINDHDGKNDDDE